jgi:hypothetical protein
MNLETIASMLEDAGLGVSGQTLFVNRMPETAVGFLLRDGYSGDYINWDYPGWRDGDFMLVYRGPSYSEGKAKIEEAMSVLSLPHGGLVGDVFYNYMRPRTTPLAYPQSNAGNTEFAVHIDVSYIVE